jgi:twitching motility two-component system response regulator PilH
MAVQKILLVDDVKTDLVALEETLASTNCLIVTAHSGQEAVAKAKSEHPDLIFMDIIMDGVNGYEACRLIKKDPTTAHIPVVFVSCKNQPADHLWAKRQGASSLISKPYTKEQIVAELTRVS